MKVRAFLLTVLLGATPIGMNAAALDPIHEHCNLSIGDRSGTFRLEIGGEDCHGESHRHCGTNRSDVAVNRITGFSLADLTNTGANLTAKLTAEAGTFECAGTVAENELHGNGTFTPNPEFVSRMSKMGYTGFTSDKLLECTYFDVKSEWVQSLKDAGVQGIDSDKIIALRIFNADADYVRGLTALGYAVPDADQLVSLRVQGVNVQEVKEIRALGYQPTFDQLVQIRIFKVTPEFIRSMQARGFKNLTLDKLVQIRIFNLAD